jgi:hypothetical protein
MRFTKKLKIYLAFAGLFFSAALPAQTYDSSTLVDTNSTSTSTSTVNSTSTSTATNNTNVNSTSTNTNTNINSGDQTIRNVYSGTQTINNNTNYSGSQTLNNNMNYSGEQTINNVQSGGTTNTNNNSNSYSGDQTIRNVQSGGTTNKNINDVTQKVIQPPPTAIAPAMMSGGNNDLCTTGTSGAVQTQILGVSTGGTVRDMNCERLKLASRLYDMGMKVAAVATLCQDRRVFDAMWNAGTPCPYEGKIGDAARELWEQNPTKIPRVEELAKDDTVKKMGIGALLGAVIYKLFAF